mmetsp:Transcript_8951/g.14919  ORF Transcript_8951/g.14919 Transcript_8951/m.14919 type:complete len:206 (-) Transcript_8951:8-625(-)
MNHPISTITMYKSFNHPQHTDMDINELTRKRVRFPAGISAMEKVREVEPVKDKSLWYSSKEYADFRESAKYSCEEVNGTGSSKALDMNPFFTKDCNQGVMDYWSLHGQSVRGFESFAHPHLGQVRKKQRARYIKSVIIAQTVAREQESTGKEMDVVKFLAYVASKESGKAKKYAMMLGKADENAIYRAKPIRRRRNSCVVVAASA